MNGRNILGWFVAGMALLAASLLTPAAALAHIVAGEAQPDPRFDITTSLCKLKDLFSRH